MKLHWFLPTSGDSRTVIPMGEAAHQRPPTLRYMTVVAKVADSMGFDGALTPTGTACEDSWIVCSALIRETERLKFLVAFRPGFVSPTLAAQQATTFQRYSNGRLLLNIVTGGNDTEQQRFGDWLPHDERYERTAEFLQVLRGAWSGDPFDFDGKHYKVRGAVVGEPPEPTPPLYIGGSSAGADEVAARYCDVALTWGEPPAMVRERLAAWKTASERAGRPLRYGIRLHVITRDRAQDAWAETDRFMEQLDDDLIDTVQSTLSRSEAVGQQRMLSLHGGKREQLVVSANLWAGIGLIRGGAGTALVGSHEEVADRIQEYYELGFEEFILSGHPHVEEAYWFGEGVMPILRKRGLIPGLPGAKAKRATEHAFLSLYASGEKPTEEHGTALESRNSAPASSH
jgi:alkanesulfonate monooxygenase